MKETAKNLLTSFEDLFLRFNFRRLLYWLFILIFGAVALVYGERATNYLYFWRIEKRIALLKELQSLEQGGIGNSSQLSPIYNELAAELATYKAYNPDLSINSAMFISLSREQVLKFFTGASVGFLILIIGLGFNIFEREGPPKKAVIGLLFWGITAGIIGLMLPTIYSPWLNYLALPILQILILVLFVYKYDKV